MSFPNFDCTDFHSFGGQANNLADDSLNALGQIIESIQLTSDSFIYKQSNETTCASCGLPIFDQFMFRVQSFYFHETCAVCNECGSSFDGRCFQRDGRLYCPRHYSRNCCAGCREQIYSTDMVYKLKSDIIFHVQCHLCSQCGARLEPGDQVLLDDDRKSVSCAMHFMDDSAEQSTSMPKESRSVPPVPVPQYPFEMYAFGEMCSENDKYLKRRGPRTTIKQHQLDVLNRVFSASSKPSKHVRAKLAAESGLSPRVIQVWFQNRQASFVL
ncbi:hypothetical protein M3Y97_00200900 [Aphelenchoides bicaudatus]|nr:hypothetical protein M3Y97_00200900 [Aphelenchoides bicaudatus]